MIQLDYLKSETAPAFSTMTFPLVQPMLRPIADGILALGAYHDDRPIGLAVAKVETRPGESEVLSLFVDPAYRRMGVGTALLHHLEQGLRDNGTGLAIANYRPEFAETAPLHRILEKLGWDRPEPSMLVCQTALAQISTAPWANQPPLEPEYDLFSWRDLTADEAADIARRQEEQAWIPTDLYPFDQDERFGAPFDRRTSVGMRYKGQVVGWAINHMWGNETLHLTCSFMRRDLQRLGRIVPLYAEIIARMRQFRIPNALWTVPMQHPAMVAFAKRRLGPYSSLTAEMMGTAKRLGGPPDLAAWS